MARPEPDPDVIAFCQKHVQLKGSKSPSLKTLFTRSLNDLNAAGFAFSLQMAERLPKRRGALFHAPTRFDESEITNFHEEVRVATAVLMLHTFEDLGVDLSKIAAEHAHSRYLRGFVEIAKNEEPAVEGRPEIL